MPKTVDLPYKRTIQKSAFRKILDSVLVDDRIDFK